MKAQRNVGYHANKWYSHNLTEEQVQTMEKDYAVIRDVGTSWLDVHNPGLYLTLGKESLDWSIILRHVSPRDMEELLKLSKRKRKSELVGLVVEAYYTTLKLGGHIVGISVNENLIP